MKKMIMTASLFTLVVGFSFGQQQQSNPADTAAPVEFERQFFVYQLANKYNDLAVAKNALYNMLAMMPGNVTVLDSLALLYYETQQYVPAALVSQDIVAINSKDELAVEIAALSFDNLGVKDKALNFYEKMYLNNDAELGVLYRMAFLQYELQRYTEATTSVNILIGDEKANDQRVYFPKSKNENQQVSLLAAAYRLRGMIEQAQDNKSAAKENFEKALEVEPEFVLAKKQLEELQK